MAVKHLTRLKEQRGQNELIRTDVTVGNFTYPWYSVRRPGPIAKDGPDPHMLCVSFHQGIATFSDGLDTVCEADLLEIVRDRLLGSAEERIDRALAYVDQALRCLYSENERKGEIP